MKLVNKKIFFFDFHRNPTVMFEPIETFKIEHGSRFFKNLPTNEKL